MIMNIKIILCLSLFLLLSNVAMAKDPEWLRRMKEIKLLSNTREDINKFLGDPVDDEKENYLWYYDFPEGRMAITYQSKQCVAPPENNGKLVGWKVPEWTVVEVSFSPDKYIKPKTLNINFEDFTSKPIYDYPEASEYRNDELGIDYVLNKGKIEYITFRPSKKFAHLQC